MESHETEYALVLVVYSTVSIISLVVDLWIGYFKWICRLPELFLTWIVDFT